MPFLDKYIKLFLGISVLGIHKYILEISVLGEYKNILDFFFGVCWNFYLERV